MTFLLCSVAHGLNIFRGSTVAFTVSIPVKIMFSTYLLTARCQTQADQVTPLSVISTNEATVHVLGIQAEALIDPITTFEYNVKITSG